MREGPVSIDFRQVVNAAGNNGALAMLERDVHNIHGTFGRFVPEVVTTEFALEMWGAVLLEAKTKPPCPDQDSTL